MGEEAGDLGVIRGPNPRYDVIVVGGGPAGSAAAIASARAGARVLLLERDTAPRNRPGETLHPGIEPLLDRLGAVEALHAATLLRHEGHWVRDGRHRGFQRFGADERGPWRGFQARRSTLDAGLRAAAVDAGAELRAGAAVSDVRRARDGRVSGIVTAAGETIAAAVVIDAGGGRHWLARQLGIGVRRLSPRYVATYGYAIGSSGPVEAQFARHAGGWTWIAPLGGGRWHWTRLSFSGRRAPRGWLPPRLRRLQPEGPSRGADVTWRVARAAAGPGWYLAGDAAAVLDPASSHGVLRALLSGLRAGEAAARPSPVDGWVPEAYNAWLQAGVARDAGALASRYPSGAGVA